VAVQTNAGDMASTDPEFSVIVVAYNSGRVLSKCMDALARQTSTNFEILLVDNGSEDGAVEALESLDHRARVLRPGGNLGFAAGNNMAAREAKADWLVLLNPDAFPAPDWLARIADAVGRYPDVTMFGSTQLKADDPAILDGAGDHYHPLGLAWRGGEGEAAELVDADVEVFGPCAAAAVYRKDVFEKVGGFAESFFCYYEDVDLAFRLRIAGETCVQLADARVEHAGSTSTGAGSDFIRYHVTRNRIWTFLRGMPGPLLCILLPALLATLIMRLLVAPFTGDFRTRARAVIDALGALPRVVRERREIQSHRRVGSREVARFMTWSIGKLALRARDGRPVTATARIRGSP
jgi:N-acetylglucosaminyl-diphospho-decaprenol L-rhamnosyltransferase